VIACCGGLPVSIGSWQRCLEREVEMLDVNPPGGTVTVSRQRSAPRVLQPTIELIAAHRSCDCSAGHRRAYGATATWRV